LSGPRMVGGLAEHGGVARRSVCREERVFEEIGTAAVTLPNDRGATQERFFFLKVCECGSSSGTSGGQGSRPSQEAERIPLLSWRIGRQVRAAMGGEKALERDPRAELRRSKERRTGLRARVRRLDAWRRLKRPVRGGGDRVNPTSVGRDETSPARRRAKQDVEGVRIPKDVTCRRWNLRVIRAPSVACAEGEYRTPGEVRAPIATACAASRQKCFEERNKVMKGDPSTLNA